MKIIKLNGLGIPLEGNDIDTDRIIPARFMRTTTFENLADNVFKDDRNYKNHSFNLNKYEKASILITNKNFGCGSSREHAPQALMRWGIKGLIGESFADIFLNNCIGLGLPCVTLDYDEIKYLIKTVQSNPKTNILIDLVEGNVKFDNNVFKLVINESFKKQLIQGTWDTLSLMLENEYKNNKYLRDNKADMRF